MSILLFPFRVIWWVISFLFSLTGRLLGIIIGSVLMVVGLALTFTFVGAVFGIPIVILGLLLIVKSVF